MLWLVFRGDLVTKVKLCSCLVGAMAGTFYAYFVMQNRKVWNTYSSTAALAGVFGGLL
jgi:uncharacterized membrane-anchored protein YjiN (DUF445 family)